VRYFCGWTYRWSSVAPSPHPLLWSLQGVKRWSNLGEVPHPCFPSPPYHFVLLERDPFLQGGCPPLIRGGKGGVGANPPNPPLTPPLSGRGTPTPLVFSPCQGRIPSCKEGSLPSGEEKQRRGHGGALQRLPR